MTDDDGTTAAAATGTLGYEQARDELIEVVRRLEAGGTTLEESLALWERGEELAKVCGTGWKAPAPGWTRPWPARRRTTRAERAPAGPPAGARARQGARALGRGTAAAVGARGEAIDARGAAVGDPGAGRQSSGRAARVRGGPSAYGADHQRPGARRRTGPGPSRKADALCNGSLPASFS